MTDYKEAFNSCSHLYNHKKKVHGMPGVMNSACVIFVEKLSSTHSVCNGTLTPDIQVIYKIFIYCVSLTVLLEFLQGWRENKTSP